LSALGVGEGGTVALLLRNDLSFIEALLAANAVGAYAVPINWHYKAEEITYILADSRASHIVAHADLLREIQDDIPHTVVPLCVPTPPELREAYAIPAERGLAPSGVTEWETVIAHPQWNGRSAQGGTMFYTSGTTGRPKGVKRESPGEAQRREFARLGQEWFGNRPGMRAVVAGPLYHSGQISYATAVMRSNGGLVILPRFDAESLLRLIAEQRLTHLHLVPIMMSRLVQLPQAVRRRYDVSSLEFVVHGAAPCPPDVKRALIEWWGPVLHEYYATTEAGMVTRASSEEWLAREGTVGKAWPGRIVRVYDDDGNLVPPYAEGEIYMSLGVVPNFSYENAEDQRAAVERDGLVTSGDVGYLDEDEYLYLCDRKSDMLISGGVNIYPAEIEAVLASHPAVIDCAVFGIPDDEFGEAIAAVVQPRSGAAVSPDELREHVRRRLASFKVPRVVELSDALPRDDSGKIFKRVLRDAYWVGTSRRI
jgi:long-chain acyl-CoA synthetase